MRKALWIPALMTLAFAACENPVQGGPGGGQSVLVETQLHGTLAIAADTVHLLREGAQRARLLNVESRVVASFEGLPVVATGHWENLGFYVTALREDITPTKPIPYL